MRPTTRSQGAQLQVSKVETVTERPSKRVAEDKSNLHKAKTLKGPKINKLHNPFLCEVPTCEIMVTAQVFGFTRETALLEHYKMHVKKGEVPIFFAKFAFGFLLLWRS